MAQKSIETLALHIDAALDRGDESELREALTMTEGFDRSALSAPDLAALDLFAANIHAGLRHLSGDHQGWKWVQAPIEQEILHLRQALDHLSDSTTRDLRTDLKLRITTNLGNVLDHVGRFVEAIELWDRALGEHPRFAMALANRGQALFWYARYVQDPTQQAILLRESYRSYRTAAALGVEPHARAEMQQWVDHLRSMEDWEALDIPAINFRSKSSKREKKYRRWCVERRLVLNPMNDATTAENGMPDTLTLPDIFVTREDSSPALPAVYAIFNQLKQEYTAARFIVFEAMEDRDRKGLHFADRGVVLYDALDYRCYRLWIEKLKMAFLSAHAVFDKIAYLINEYWKLSLDIRSTNFNAIWYRDGDVRKGLCARFDDSNNWPLRGLHWLSRDFYYKPKSLQAVLPEAKVIHDIRNHIAHKYLRVHDDWLYSASGERKQVDPRAGYPVTDRELEVHTLTLLKLVRSALIYLSSAVAHEEADKRKTLNDFLVLPMPITMVSERYRP